MLGNLPTSLLLGRGRASHPRTGMDFIQYRDRFDRPIMIVSSPRSGSTLLFETLAQAPQLFTVRNESHGLIERIPGLGPFTRGWDSNRLAERDLTPEIGESLARSFYDALMDRDGARPDGSVRMLEKTPKNALRVPFFHALWPDIRLVYLYRDPRQTIASMARGWESGRFRTYPRLPDWRGLSWSFLLVPGWEQLRGLPVLEIAARQWSITTTRLIDDLSSIPASQVRAIDYDEFLASPQAQIESLSHSLDLDWDRTLPSTLPPSRMTLTSPQKDKWRSLEAEIAPLLPLVAEADEQARSFLAQVRKSA